MKDSGQKSTIRQSYGLGSKSTTTRKNNLAKGVRVEAKKSLSIQDVFKRQIDLRLSQRTEGKESSLAVSISLDSVRRGFSSEKEKISAKDREIALKDFERLLSLKTEQVKKYGQVLSPNSNFLRRHEMVLRLLRIQKHKEKYLKKNRRSLATVVANVDN